MICKKDVISWFKELESYKRIDTMCALLNMCLPFELRFLGTCLEELGRRDSQELRGIELRVNNPQDLAIDMAACQKGEPTDKKIRRKMALYLALIRACNRSCVTEIFKTLDGWGRRDFSKLNDSDTLQELLLVYTMAANHPVFTFEQHMTCAEIFEKIKENRLVCDYREQQQSRPATTPSNEHHHMVVPQQHQTIHMHPGQHQSMQAPIQVISQGSIPMSFPQAHLSKMIPSDGTLQHQITVDGITHMLSSNIAIPAELTLAHPNAWSVRSNIQNYPTNPGEQHHPQSSSPMLSQQSSPSNSRAASPNRTSGSTMFQGQQQQQSMQQVRNLQRTGLPLRNVRRPSAETTPPPAMQQHQQMMGSINNEMIAPQNIKNMEEGMVNSEGSMTQLQALIRNGYARPGNHTLPRLSKSAINLQHHSQMQQQQQHQQQQQQQHQQQHQQQQHQQQQHHQQQQLNQHFQSLSSSNFGISSSLAYTLQNMSLVEGPHPQMENSMMAVMNQHKSAGSDSGSSIGSSGDISPPETPSLIGNNSGIGSIKLNEQQHKQQQQQQASQKQQQQQQLNYNKQINIARINGRSDKLLPISVGSNTGSATLIYPPATSPQQHYLGNDIILTSGPNMMQSSLTNNNQVGGSGNDGVGSGVVCSGGISANNNLGANTVLITSPSAINPAGGGVISNVITSNSVILQPAQHQQYTAAHPYHAQHIASTTRPPIIPHSHGIAGPSPHGTFRLPSFQIPPNGELIYPYHPAGIAFLSGTAPPPTAVAAVRSSPTTSVPPPTTTNVIQLPQPPPLQQQSVLPQAQTNPPPPSAALLTTSPYTSLTVGVSKQLSCYNCGSQTHNGRDCNEASMEDVTRGAIYKLDYSVSSSVSPTGPQTSGESLTGNNSNCISCTQQSMTTIEMGAESTSPTASTSSSSSLSNSNVNPK